MYPPAQPFRQPQVPDFFEPPPEEPKKQEVPDFFESSAPEKKAEVPKAIDYGYGPRWDEKSQSYSGKPKGLGHLGPLLRSDGKTVESEYSIDGEINGKPTQYPSIVPTLTKEEVNTLLNAKDSDKLPDSIYQKAEAYATQRVNAGKDPFAGPGEQQNLYPEIPRQKVTPNGTKFEFPQAKATGDKSFLDSFSEEAKGFLSKHPLIQKFFTPTTQEEYYGKDQSLIGPKTRQSLDTPLLPEMTSQAAGRLTRGVYNKAVRPLSSPANLISNTLLGAATPKSIPNVGEVESEIPKTTPEVETPPPAAESTASPQQPEKLHPALENLIKQDVMSRDRATEIHNVMKGGSKEGVDIPEIATDNPVPDFFIKAEEVESPKPPSAPFASRLADWVNARSASDVAGYRNKQLFQHLDREGIKGILDYQENPSDPLYNPLKEYFSGKREELLKSGLEMGDKGDHYLPQLWDNTPQEIEAATGQRLGLKPSFSFESVVKDYHQGISMGLVPKFEKLSDLAGWYEKTAEKNLVDRNFWNSMKENGEISRFRSTQTPVALDPNTTPNFVSSKNTRVWYASPNVAQKINNVLGQASGPLQTASNITGTMKNMMMSVGVPGTGISPHGFSTLARGALFDPSMVPDLAMTMLSPRRGLATIDASVMDGRLERFMKAGMTFSSEEHSFSALTRPEEVSQSKIINALEDAKKVKDNLFEKPIFGRLVPSAKINLATKLEESMIKKGVEEGQATKEAAHAVNNIFGGINVKELGRDPNFQASLRTFFFAPDFAESNINISKEVVKSLMNPNDAAGAPYRKAVMNLAALYVGGNLLNKKLSGHFMFENDPTHTFSIETGAVDSQGKKQHINILGSAAAVPQLLSEVASAIAHNRADMIPNIVRARLSPTANLAGDIVTNKDFAGRNILGPNKFGQPQTPAAQLGNLGRVISDRTLPSSPTAAYDYATGNISGQQALPRVLGLPETYSKDPDEQQPTGFRLQQSMRP
jgi:hypothetical protein